jgi:hypothetical protein
MDHVVAGQTAVRLGHASRGPQPKLALAADAHLPAPIKSLTV